MKFVVAGCGFVGEQLRIGLLDSGHEVVGLSLSGTGETEACDLSDLDSVSNIARNFGQVDGIVHCASSGRGGDRAQRYRNVYLRGCENLLAAFPQARLIFTSSTSVYAQINGEIVDEKSPAEPAAETGRILREAEELVIANGGIAARLAGIYGPGRSFLLKRFLQGEAEIDGRWINQIHRDDAASALAILLEKQDARGIYNVADDTPLAQLECYEEFSRRFDLPVPPEGIPDPNRKRGWTNKRVSNGKLRSQGWIPRYRSYLHALDEDAQLVPSIRSQMES